MCFFPTDGLKSLQPRRRPPPSQKDRVCDLSTQAQEHIGSSQCNFAQKADGLNTVDFLTAALSHNASMWRLCPRAPPPH